MLSIHTIIIGIVSMFILYVLCRIFINPIKWLLKLLLSCLFSIPIMLGANYLLSKIGIAFSINPLTAMIGGVLGLPGMIMTLILQSIL